MVTTLNDCDSLKCHLLSKSSNGGSISDADANTAPTLGPSSASRKLQLEDFSRGPSPPSATKTDPLSLTNENETRKDSGSQQPLTKESEIVHHKKRRRRVQPRDSASLGGLSQQSQSSAEESDSRLQKLRVRSRTHLNGMATKRSDRSGRSIREESSFSSSSDSRQRHASRRAQAHRVPVIGACEDIVQPQNGTNRHIPGLRVSMTSHEFSRGLSYAAFDRGAMPVSRGHNAFSIRHKWLLVSHQFDFWFRDRFHMLLSLSFKSLVVFLVFAEAIWAAGLAIFLAIVTQGDVENCLGGIVKGWMHYYYFTVETMFTIGFGNPRSPSCLPANIFVSFAVMLTNVLHGTLIGLVFSKFSSGTTRRWAMAFSPAICGALSGELYPMGDADFDSPPTLSPHVKRSYARPDSTPSASIAKPHDTYAHDDQRSIQTLSERLNDDKLSDEMRSVAQSLNSPRASVNPSRAFCRRKSSLALPATQARELQKYYQHTYDSTGITRSTFRSAAFDASFYGDPTSSTHEHYLSSGAASGRFKSPSYSKARTLFPRRVQPLRQSFQGVPEEQNMLPLEVPSERDSLTIPLLIPRPVTDMAERSLRNPPERCDSLDLNTYDHVGVSYYLSFRLMNLTDSSFFDPKLSIFLLCHDLHDLTITQVLRYHTNIPLEFLEMPITVTIDSRDTESPLHRISLPELVKNGGQYELMVLLTFVDNQSSRTIELRKSWRLDCITWGQGFKNIVRRDEKGCPGAYDVDIEALDEKYVLEDELNASFIRAVANNQSLMPSRQSRALSEDREANVVIPVQRPCF